MSSTGRSGLIIAAALAVLMLGVSKSRAGHAVHAAHAGMVGGSGFHAGHAHTFAGHAHTFGGNARSFAPTFAYPISVSGFSRGFSSNYIYPISLSGRSTNVYSHGFSTPGLYSGFYSPGLYGGFYSPGLYPSLGITPTYNSLLPSAYGVYPGQGFIQPYRNTYGVIPTVNYGPPVSFAPNTGAAFYPFGTSFGVSGVRTYSGYGSYQGPMLYRP
jgi:hypothetical protein